ncbi:ribonuclease P protein component [Chloroherpeton thalassium ATCC 35110]|uniref:Ribonuclease P protein component n=1 Tax=Chloroherpeton thalassium (strain ATCC 35110 / GB-78) TaxID=517418 RepID=B3QYV8_CHLT3|nr:ribonuclease P protein component [Chloroherpeton thalassium]ACF15181.1 ribonuclease P protein component [Chloroherpeton thalassium ATCC 35110]
MPPIDAAGSSSPERRASLRKYERLCLKKQIERVYTNGATVRVSFLKVKFISLEDAPHEKGLPKVLFAVSKRMVRTAADRNKLKRLMREAYRTQKDVFGENEICQGSLHRSALAIAFMFQASGDKLPCYQKMQSVMRKCLRKVCTAIEKTNSGREG